MPLGRERARIETALAMKDIEMANPVTLSISRACASDIGGTGNVMLHRGQSGALRAPHCAEKMCVHRAPWCIQFHC